MRIKVWGARGSVPSPGPMMNRYGGNTSCVQLTLASGEDLILDAGTGIRTLGLGLATAPKVNILLTHLHLDHIQGLMFSAVLSPRCGDHDLGARVARGVARGPRCSLHLRSAVAGRGAGASLFSLLS